MVDVDIGASENFNKDSFLSNFIYADDSWIGFTATQTEGYYDIWALRAPPALTYDCWQKISELTSFFLDSKILVEKIIGIHQKPIQKSTGLIPVQSAFGGGALYSRKFLSKNCTYNGYKYQGLFQENQTCEHVSFHQCLVKVFNGTHIYINPQFQIG